MADHTATIIIGHVSSGLFIANSRFNGSVLLTPGLQAVVANICSIVQFMASVKGAGTTGDLKALNLSVFLHFASLRGLCLSGVVSLDVFRHRG